MKNLRDLIKSQRLYFDGGFGTVLQSMGLKAGTPPESWNLTDPDKVTALHKAYIDAGSNIITTNTFGVNRSKYDNYEEYINAAISCAKAAANDRCFIAFDIGPSGKMLEPLGDLSFEDAVDLFKANVKAAVNAGVDCIIIETMNDAYETKAAVLAAKESCDLPIFVTNVYDKSGKLMTGADPEAMIAMLEGLGVSALGLNCSFGPDVMLPLIDRFVNNSSLPIIVNPNAGLPQIVDGKTVFNISPDEFASYMQKIAQKGASLLGGCCGTTPEHIRKTVEATKDIPLAPLSDKGKTVVSSYTHAVNIENKPILIGERINPTGKSKLKQALRDKNFNYILNEGLRQAKNGVHILDVNVGLPEIDEIDIMQQAVKRLQAVCDLPLQIDSSNPAVLERSMRIYNGKPLINSVNGKQKSMHEVFPLVKKYGGVVIALTMDENGIPSSADERVAIAEKIASQAAEYGIGKKDIIVDPLCLTVSSDSKSALVTLKSVKMLAERGFKTSLGVSNISFGLPEREKINTSFFNSALENGLNCAIMNPFSEGMMDVYYSFCALHDMDSACAEYIAYASSNTSPQKTAKIDAKLSLSDAIIQGLKDSAVSTTKELLESTAYLDIINSHIIPALNEVGKSFEAKKSYLPQLLMSADAACAAFEEIKAKMSENDANNGRKIILATVKGDIHDIGKNIV
ncbi:MAG: homocysteine S-methyltransferase family protein, partial [Clostridia bacterium]|nr:homocysteine S-methyltransferase family protein [Clostridia bacterium]